MAEAVPAMERLRRFSGGAARSGLSLPLSFPRNRENKPCDGLLTLGERCASVESRVMSEKELGVGLDGRPNRLVLEANAELRADGYCLSGRMLCAVSSRLVEGRSV